MIITVLKGGTSTEREISLISGEAVAEALRENGHEVLELDTTLPIEQLKINLVPPVVTDDNEKLLDANLVKLLLTPEVQESHLIFVALHGGNGENGTIQGLLEMVGIPYTGTGVEGSAIAMNKHLSKLIFKEKGIPTPEWEIFERSVVVDKYLERIVSRFSFPLIIKPNNEGSTIGLTLVETLDGIEAALNRAWMYSRYAMVEQYIPGREITVALLGDEPFPVVEVKPKHKLYDYDCKYREGLSEYEVPAVLDERVEQEVKQISLEVFRLLRGRHFARVDLRLSPENKPYVLEMNTVPGMTGTSLVPKAAKAAGYSFNELVEKIVNLALEDGTE